MNKIPFEESQRFRQWWLWLLLVIVLVFSFFPLYNSSSQKVDLNWQNLIGPLVILLLIIFFSMLKLKTRIDQKGIHYRFHPVHFSTRSIEWKDVDSCYIRKYKPLSEYGGYGLRWGAKGSAKNVSGNIGLQLKLKNGKRILIGTQKPIELKEGLNSRQRAGHIVK